MAEERSATNSEAAPAPEADRWATFDRWAHILFLSLAVLGGVAGLTILGASASGALSVTVDPLVARIPGLVGVVAALAVAAILTLYGVARGLATGRPWARPAAVSLLVLMLVTGVADAVLDLATAAITIPLGAILAAIVLSRKPGPLPAVHGRDRGIVAVVTAVGLASLVPAAFPGQLLTAASSPLVADPGDLELTLSAGCDVVPSRPLPAPVRATVTVTWHWTARDTLPLQPDALEIAWAVPSGLTPARDAIVLPPGVTEGGGVPAAGILPADGPPESSLVWSIDPGGPAAGGGTLVVPFDGAVGAEGLGTNITATFAHGTAWTRAESVACEIEIPPDGG